MCVWTLLVTAFILLLLWHVSVTLPSPVNLLSVSSCL